MLVAKDCTGLDRLLEQMAVADLPMVDPGTAANRHATKVSRCFHKCATGPGLTARAPAPRRQSGNIIGKLACLAIGPSSIRAQPELDAFGHWWAQFEASPEPVRGHRILKQDPGRKGPSDVHACRAAAQVAPLPIAERAPLPGPAAHDAQGCVGAVGTIAGEIRPARTPVVETRKIGLQFGRTPNRAHPARPATPLLVRCAMVGGPTCVFGDRDEAVAAGCTA